MNEWKPIETAPRDTAVLVACALPSGKLVRLIAVFCSKHTQEASDQHFGDDWCDYDETTDTYYCPEGWYEQIKNWDELSAVHISDMNPALWQHLPELPEPIQ
ncbi:hypothetical protein ACODUO_15075 [Stenotrophomonas maltophilia]